MRKKLCEAGRGCLAGPVYAAAVILPPDFRNDLLNDSKQLTERHRYQLREIIQREAVAWLILHQFFTTFAFGQNAEGKSRKWLWVSCL